MTDRRDPRVWRADEITQLHGLPVLAEIELVETPEGRLEGAATALTELSHLANTIRAKAHMTGSASALVGASAGDATGWVSGRLALTLSRSGDRVALVSASPDPAAATSTLRVAPPTGLAQVLTGTAPVVDVLVSVKDAPSLAVIGVGADGRLGAEWLNSAAMRDLVAELDHRNAFVVLDSAAVPLSGDAQAMASLARNAVIVAELGVTTPEELAAATRTIAAVDTPLLGVVAVRRNRPKSWHLFGRRRHAATNDTSASVPTEPPTRAAARRGNRAARVSEGETARPTAVQPTTAGQQTDGSPRDRRWTETERLREARGPTETARK